MAYTSTFVYIALYNCPTHIKEQIIKAFTNDKAMITYKTKVFNDKKGNISALNVLLPNRKLVDLLKKYEWLPLKPMSIQLI